MEKPIVLIDDERTIQATVTAVLQRHGFAVSACGSASQGRRRCAELPRPELVLLDLGLPDADGLDVLRELRASQPDIPVIILTGNDSLANAIESIKLGAYHFLPKPYAAEELVSLCRRAVEQNDLTRQTAMLRQANAALEKKRAVLEKKLREAEEQLAPVVVSRRMKEMRDLVVRVAPSSANVLLTGESGVGKEVFADEIHRRSPRAGGPIVRLNCAAFPANMIEGELFGYAKGAFTGAVSAFPGLISAAEGGTLFLDEVTEMPLELQTRFLRVLQEREYRPLGTTKPLPANFRLIAACNRPPQQAVREGRLRPDLYFRLNTFEIEIPPLRERREDIPKLADTFLRRFAAEMARPVPHMDAEALELLRAWPWPGNVRELQNAIEHALVLCDGPVLDAACLPREIRLGVPRVSSSAAHESHGTSASHTAREASPPNGGSLEDVERQAVLEALRDAHGNKKRAAERLGIQRATLYAKIRRYGITA